MTCAEIEILLCDLLDGTLDGPEQAAVEQHLAACITCTEFARDVGQAISFMDRAAVVEPPAELLTRVLHQAPVGRQANDVGGRSWWRRIFGGVFESVLQPKYAMSMAMTILSISMLWKFAPQPLRPSDLDPVKLWANIDDHANRVWDRAMKYYQNLKLVIEVESQLKEWSEQEQPGTATDAQGANRNAGTPANKGTNQ